MYIEKTEIVIEGKSVNADLQYFDSSDLLNLKDHYLKWVDLSDSLEQYGGRRINLPEILSEAIYCINFTSARLTKSVSGISTSFDCYNLASQSRIQVKACSVEEDLTSFGPNSVWDELYFVHFFPNLQYDGSYAIYKIDNDLIYKHQVSKTQTFTDVQRQGKRPRFSIIRDLIKPNNIQPLIKSSL